jgi:oligoendopeptidase F
VSLLRGAGVDMTGREPFEEMMSKMNRLMDAIERILGGAAGTSAGHRG